MKDKLTKVFNHPISNRIRISIWLFCLAVVTLFGSTESMAVAKAYFDMKKSL
jgi:hypothetical protein